MRGKELSTKRKKKESKDTKKPELKKRWVSCFVLRQFLQKGEDLSTHSQEELDHIAWLLNTRPRKRFEFKTPQELMETELDGGIIRVALDS